MCADALAHREGSRRIRKLSENTSIRVSFPLAQRPGSSLRPIRPCRVSCSDRKVTTPAHIVGRPPLIALLVLSVAVAGGILAAAPLILARAATAYLQAWLGLGTVDPTWNDGDGGFVLVAVAVVLVLLAAVGVAAAALARRGGIRRGTAAALAVAVAVAVGVLGSAVVLQPN